MSFLFIIIVITAPELEVERQTAIADAMNQLHQLHQTYFPKLTLKHQDEMETGTILIAVPLDELIVIEPTEPYFFYKLKLRSLPTPIERFNPMLQLRVIRNGVIYETVIMVDEVE